MVCGGLRYFDGAFIYNTLSNDNLFIYNLVKICQVIHLFFINLFACTGL